MAGRSAGVPLSSGAVVVWRTRGCRERAPTDADARAKEKRERTETQQVVEGIAFAIRLSGHPCRLLCARSTRSLGADWRRLKPNEPASRERESQVPLGARRSADSHERTPNRIGLGLLAGWSRVSDSIGPLTRSRCLRPALCSPCTSEHERASATHHRGGRTSGRGTPADGEHRRIGWTWFVPRARRRSPSDHSRRRSRRLLLLHHSSSSSGDAASSDTTSDTTEHGGTSAHRRTGGGSCHSRSSSSDGPASWHCSAHRRCGRTILRRPLAHPTLADGRSAILRCLDDPRPATHRQSDQSTSTRIGLGGDDDPPGSTGNTRAAGPDASTSRNRQCTARCRQSEQQHGSNISPHTILAALLRCTGSAAVHVGRTGDDASSGFDTDHHDCGRGGGRERGRRHPTTNTCICG